MNKENARGMQDDVISRQAAIEIVEKYFEKIGLNGDICVDGLRQLPPIQPKRGKWIDKGWTGDWRYLTDGRGNCWRNIVCSECGESVSHESNFCPNCGADMRGEHDE